jgi:hypothetical protein
MNRTVQSQFESNRTTAGDWDLFAAHRARLSALIREAAPSGRPSRLCVLGAGNCNDLDLPSLVPLFAQTHLVDLDGEAMRRGVERQNMAGGPALHRHAGVDITGCLGAMAAWSAQTAMTDAELERCATLPVTGAVPHLPGPFDLVVSACVLSQIVYAVVDALGERHPRFIDAVRAMRLGHLRLLAELVAPGGTGILCSDVVSSDSFPGLPAVAPQAMAATVFRLVHEGNFFHGLNPAVVVSQLRSDPVLRAQATDVEYRPPWLWTICERSYAVYAITFRKCPAAGGALPTARESR